MALSDYLTADEWEACWYCFAGNKVEKNGNFGNCMHATIDAMLATGYRFAGLDDRGEKRQQLHGTGNPQRLMAVMGLSKPAMTQAECMRMFDGGRRFIKQHAPHLLDETDDDWAEQMAPFAEPSAA